MAMGLRGLHHWTEGLTVEPGDHPFVERIRAEREMVAAVNAYRSIFVAELAGTSAKAVTAWFDGVPPAVRHRDEVRILRERLVEAGRSAKLASTGSHRGAMVGERLRRAAVERSVTLVKTAASRVLAGHGTVTVGEST